MPKGFTDDGRPIMTKEEFIEQFKFDLEMREITKRNEINKKALKDFNEDNANEMKKLNKHTKQAAKTTTTKKSNETFDLIVDMLQDKTEFSDLSVDKTTITFMCKSDKYEAKWQSKREAFSIDEYSGTKDATKNKIIKYICDIDTDCTITPIDKSGLIGVIDGDNYYTVKITKKRA